ncbi:cold-shock protein, putative [Plasmodium ovale curtisi]|uniref:Cold-shock protein, putative n=1 Tax=Plasmodium ovale curtisi TaxID=864141 RepID=A0A1A8VHX0_PLAOA|nr:cold-shock protein, putative [Plasmodium ovale curtisi]
MMEAPIFLGFSVTGDEKRKLTWNSSMHLSNKKDDINFEITERKKKDEINSEFKYLIPGELVKFSVMYDQKSHSSSMSVQHVLLIEKSTVKGNERRCAHSSLETSAKVTFDVFENPKCLVEGVK